MDTVLVSRRFVWFGSDGVRCPAIPHAAAGTVGLSRKWWKFSGSILHAGCVEPDQAKKRVPAIAMSA